MDSFDKDFPALRRRMVDNQLRPSEITEHELIRAFETVPREIFVEPDQQPFAYSDLELKLPAAGKTVRRMIDPVQLARLIQALNVTPEKRVLVVGCGTGYSATILSRLAGSVVALEEDNGLADLAAANLRALGADNAAVVRGPLSGGWPDEAPYHAILLDGAVEVVPEVLQAQLALGGLLAGIERQDSISRAMLYERFAAGITRWPQFEAWATLLPGFERKREFVF
jgi:protein-L-isoaspartate(D-aspartate) O-methyltransferase